MGSPTPTRPRNSAGGGGTSSASCDSFARSGPTSRKRYRVRPLPSRNGGNTSSAATAAQLCAIGSPERDGSQRGFPECPNGAAVLLRPTRSYSFEHSFRATAPMGGAGKNQVTRPCTVRYRASALVIGRNLGR
jgi:hypothetical protein